MEATTPSNKNKKIFNPLPPCGVPTVQQLYSHCFCTYLVSNESLDLELLTEPVYLLQHIKCINTRIVRGMFTIFWYFGMFKQIVCLCLSKVVCENFVSMHLQISMFIDWNGYSIFLKRNISETCNIS